MSRVDSIQPPSQLRHELRDADGQDRTPSTRSTQAHTQTSDPNHQTRRQQAQYRRTPFINPYTNRYQTESKQYSRSPLNQVTTSCHATGDAQIVQSAHVRADPETTTKPNPKVRAGGPASESGASCNCTDALLRVR